MHRWANELRTWWAIVIPIIRPLQATADIFTFVNSWNDFFWPATMLHTRDR